LGSQNFVAAQQHGDAATDHQNSNEIFRLSPANRHYLRMIGFSFNPAIPAQIIVGTVPVIFTVIFIVFVIVAH
jgi:hypothetical protein